MDNHFVPNLTLGLPVVEALLATASPPVDCHLMIEDPDRWAPAYAEAGAGSVTFHVEAAAAPVRLARSLRAAGARAGMALKPATPIEPYADLLPELDMVLLMTVEPGFGGQSFLDVVVPKIRRTRELLRGRTASTCGCRSTAASTRRTIEIAAPRPAPTCSSPARRCTARPIRPRPRAGSAPRRRPRPTPPGGAPPADARRWRPAQLGSADARGGCVTLDRYERNTCSRVPSSVQLRTVGSPRPGGATPERSGVEQSVGSVPPVSQRNHELRAMKRALILAVSPDVPRGPNPRVGCVLLAPDGEIVGEGHHRGAGTEHAEVDALAKAGDAARGATAVVTLEPCDHSGRTGPCTQALIGAGVARVVYAQTDPNPVAAGGAAVLRAAGLDVEGGLFAAQAMALNETWTFAVAEGRPFVTWKSAATLDGRVAAADGTSRWITSAAARAEVHDLRAEVDAVMVGTGTVVADDPQLTVRDEEGAMADVPQPLRVVVGMRDLPAGARVLDGSTPSLQLRTRDPQEVLRSLHEREVRHVLLEGGPRLAAAFVRAGLVDRVVWYVAPALLGSGPSALGDAGMSGIGDALRLRVSTCASSARTCASTRGSHACRRGDVHRDRGGARPGRGGRPHRRRRRAADGPR